MPSSHFSFVQEKSYPEFITLLHDGEIDKATIKEESITFTLKNGIKYKTANPSSPTLKEELLLSGVSVKEDNTSFNTIFDALFNIFFIALIAFGLYKLLSYSRKTFKMVRHTGVKFSSIAGMRDIKEELLFVVNNLKAKDSSMRDIKGIILEGPPGNGKTMFAKALAEECNISYIATKGADFQGALMGLGAFKVKMLFNKARKNKPCIVFIDEFDSIGERRNYAGSGIDKENNRILTTLLNEMDGFTASSGVLVIAATNSYDSLDPALIRPGRFDLKFKINNPDRETRKELIRMYSSGKVLSSDLTEDALSVAFEGLSCSAIETILNEAETIRKLRNAEKIDLQSLLIASEKTQIKLNIRIKKN